MKKRTVLFVDDEEHILNFLKSSLLDEPYELLFANGGQQALEILKQQDVHVIVADVRMPEMSGLEFLRIVKKNYPHIVRMVLSAYTDVETLLIAANEIGIFKFLTKSDNLMEQLMPAVMEALDYYDVHCENEVTMEKMK